MDGVALARACLSLCASRSLCFTGGRGLFVCLFAFSAIFSSFRSVLPVSFSDSYSYIVAHFATVYYCSSTGSAFTLRVRV